MTLKTIVRGHPPRAQRHPVHSGGKPLRKVAWTRYSAGELNDAGLTHCSPDHSPVPDREMRV